MGRVRDRDVLDRSPNVPYAMGASLVQHFIASQEFWRTVRSLRPSGFVYSKFAMSLGDDQTLSPQMTVHIAVIYLYDYVFAVA